MSQVNKNKSFVCEKLFFFIFYDSRYDAIIFDNASQL